MEIFIICIYSTRGRVVVGGADTAAKATEKADELARAYRADGWTKAKTNTIPPAERFRDASGVEVAAVWHLKNNAGDWLNIELYKIAI